MAIDDHARLAFTAMHPDETQSQAILFLRNAVAYYARLGIKHSFARPYRPQTNGKAERLIQSALRERAYGWTYQNSAHRTDALASWQHHYNWHRPHTGIAPMSRHNSSRNNLLTLHS
ncbi:hypothetical protein GmRootV35_11930 [Variovorax sp. V35]